MDAQQFERLGLSVRSEDKLNENPNGPSWDNDTSCDAPYSLPPESSERRAGVVRGEIVKHTAFESATFPGTTRDWWIYVPAAYERGVSQDVNLLVFQDGSAYIGETAPGQSPPDPKVKDGRQVQACVALDNLHDSNEVPLTVAVFINPGTSSSDPLQRSFEYDTLSPLYSEFLSSELLPLVDAACPGISPDPMKRCIVGASSGGIAAFTVAWHTAGQPGGFGRVISHVGSFTNIRGGHNYPWLVRNSKKKPIAKVFLQGGAGKQALSFI